MRVSPRGQRAGVASDGIISRALWLISVFRLLSIVSIIPAVSRASALYRLQKVDTELDQRRAQLAEVEARLASSPAVQEAQANLATVQNELAAARRSAKALDDENQDLTTKIKENEGRLYGGKVRNPRELQDLQADIQALKRRRDELDENQLAAMEAVEAGEQTEAAARTALSAAEAARADEQRDLAKDKGALEALIAKLEGEREAALISVSTEDRATYDSLRRQKGGKAIAQLVEGTCGLCGVAPSSSRIQAARQSGELVRCGNCGRILYAEQGTGYASTDDKEDEMIQRW